VNTIDNIAEAIKAGAAGVTAENRTIDIKASVRGVETVVPYAFNAQGEPRFLKEVLDVATAAADQHAPRRQGRYQFSDLASILAWATRYKTAETSAYLQAPTQSPGSLTIIVDELPGNESGGQSGGASDKGTNRTLRATLPIALHDRLKAWVATQEQWLDAAMFCSFVGMAGDELSSAELLSMVQNLEVTSATTWKRTVDDKGAVRVQTEDKSGPATRIPRDFKFAVPAFEFDDVATQFDAKLFSKIEKGQPMFRFTITDLKRTIALAMKVTHEVVSEVVPATQVYLGTPP
jgi:hypothetical protein